MSLPRHACHFWHTLKRHPHLERDNSGGGKSPNCHSHTLSQAVKYRGKAKLIFVGILNTASWSMEWFRVPLPTANKLSSIRGHRREITYFSIYSLFTLRSTTSTQADITGSIFHTLLFIILILREFKQTACLGVTLLKLKADLKPRCFYQRPISSSRSFPKIRGHFIHHPDQQLIGPHMPWESWIHDPSAELVPDLLFSPILGSHP